MPRRRSSAALKAVAIPIEVELSGLCTTCEFQQQCRLNKTPEKEILFCEEFSPYADPHMRVSFSESIIERPEKVLSTRQGLCANCELAATCTFPQPEGGVWHCEEYR